MELPFAPLPEEALEETGAPGEELDEVAVTFAVEGDAGEEKLSLLLLLYTLAASPLGGVDEELPEGGATATPLPLGPLGASSLKPIFAEPWLFPPGGGAPALLIEVAASGEPEAGFLVPRPPPPPIRGARMSAGLGLCRSSGVSAPLVATPVAPPPPEGELEDCPPPTLKNPSS